MRVLMAALADDPSPILMTESALIRKRRPQITLAVGGAQMQA
jgi:hypothetical protein